jgi:ATP-dependent Clp protease ATP-binding subunit ClpA
MDLLTDFINIFLTEEFPWVLIVAIILYAGYFLYKKKGGNLSSSATKTLDMFALDLTAQAKDGTIDPVVGRDEEIDRLIQILSRRTKNNAILIGMPGVGKTAIVEGLANRIAHKEVPEILAHKRVLLLQVSELLAGTKYRGEFEQRIKAIVQEIKAHKRSIILFIDEIHTVTQAKGTEGAVNLSDILKPALARGDLQLVGATTHKEYEQYIKPDESWERRFQIVTVPEPSISESINILKGLRKEYEDYHKVKISDEAISAAVRLSEIYIKGRNLPDKAIDLMDEAAAMVNVARGSGHEHAAAVLHGASKMLSENNSKKIPTVKVEHIKEVIADWLSLNISEINDKL